MRPEIVLIGPFGAGKSTVGELLAEHLRLPTVSMDANQHYYAEAGFDKNEFRRLWDKASPHAADRYFHTFFPSAVQRLLTDYHNCVFDLGAGHTVYEDENLFARAQDLLSPFPNVVLILPSLDLDLSIRILRERAQHKHGSSYFLNSTEFDYFSHWVKCHCNFDLAKYTVYTEGKTPAQTRDELLALLHI